MQLKFMTTADGHQVAYAEFGAATNIPLLFLHGGPGSEAHAADAELFNPQSHRIVMFDQRGCGRSTPSGDIRDNTLSHLLQDIEQLRKTLNIQRWKVYGGSWGATVALEYAKQHTERVISLILRGSFLARQQDLDWFIQPDGLARQHPRAYRQLCAQLQAQDNQPLTSRLYQLLTDGDEPQAYQAALAWDHWEATVMGVPLANAETDNAQRSKRIDSKRIYAHYCHRQFFLDENGVLLNLEQLHTVPVTLIHGRNDQVCLPEAAETAHKVLPDSTLIMVDAGHSLHETAIRAAIASVLS